MTDQQQIEYDKWLSIGEPFRDDDRYQDFLRKIIISNCPVILSYKHLAVLLDVDYTVLLAMINHSSSFYYEFSIPKRSGGERKISLCRELTKLNEEILRMTLDTAIAYYEENQPRGEYVLIMEGASAEEKKANAFWAEMTEAEHVQHYVDSGMSKSDAIKATAKDRGVGKSDIYNLVMKK